MNAKVILLVEDDEADVYLTTRALVKSGLDAELVVVHNCLEAWDMLGPHLDADLAAGAGTDSGDGQGFGDHYPSRAGEQGGSQGARSKAGLRPVLVLIDLTVPRMGGLGLLGAIRAHPETRALPVVTLTRSDADPTVEPGSQLGANGHVVKPMSAGQFLTTAQAAVLSRPEAL